MFQEYDLRLFGWCAPVAGSRGLSLPAGLLTTERGDFPPSHPACGIPGSGVQSAPPRQALAASVELQQRCLHWRREENGFRSVFMGRCACVCAPVRGGLLCRLCCKMYPEACSSFPQDMAPLLGCLLVYSQEMSLLAWWRGIAWEPNPSALPPRHLQPNLLHRGHWPACLFAGLSFAILHHSQPVWPPSGLWKINQVSTIAFIGVFCFFLTGGPKEKSLPCSCNGPAEPPDDTQSNSKLTDTQFKRDI